jgi:hypothetical protein
MLRNDFMELILTTDEKEERDPVFSRYSILPNFYNPP